MTSPTVGYEPGRTVSEGGGSSRPLRRQLVALRRSGFDVLLATLLLAGAIALVNESFLTSFNLFNLSRTAGLSILIALAQMIVLVIGHLNLSLGGMGALGVVAVGFSLDTMGWSPGVAVAVALGVGVAAGIVNGALIVGTGVSSFVITLGTLFVFQGIVTGVTEGQPFVNIPEGFTILGRGSSFGLANILIVSTAVLLLVAVMFRRTVVGRHLLAMGGNLAAAQRMGVKTTILTITAHAMSGLFAGLAAVLWVSRTGAAQPGTGSDWLIISFAVAIIGGTALTGGVVAPLGLFAAAWLLALIRNGLVMVDANVYFEQAFLGALILTAVVFANRDFIAAKFKTPERRRK